MGIAALLAGLCACGEPPRLRELTPLADDTALIFAERGAERFAYAVDPRGIRWRSPLDARPITPHLGRWAAASTGHVAIVVRSDEGTRLVGLDRDTGTHRYVVSLDALAPRDGDDTRPGGVWSDGGAFITTAPSANGTMLSLHDESGAARWRSALSTGREPYPHDVFAGRRRLAITMAQRFWLIDRETGALIHEGMATGTPCRAGRWFVVYREGHLSQWDLDSEDSRDIAAAELVGLGAIDRCGTIANHSDEVLMLWGPSPSYALTRVALSDGNLRWRVPFPGATLATHTPSDVAPHPNLGLVKDLAMLALSGFDDPSAAMWRALVAIDVSTGRVVSTRRWPDAQPERRHVLPMRGPAILAYDYSRRRLDRYELTADSADAPTLVSHHELDADVAAPMPEQLGETKLWLYRRDAPVAPDAWYTLALDHAAEGP